MKKLLSLVLTVVMLLTTVIYVTAADTQTTISLTLDESMESYTLTIPASVEIDPTTKSGTMNVNITDYEFVWSDSIIVSASFCGSLVNTEDESKSIAYEIENGDGEKSSTGFGRVLYVYKDSTRSTCDSAELEIFLKGDYPGAGTYTDTITFTVKHEAY